MAYGSAVVDEADRLIEQYRSLGYTAAEYFAAMFAKGLGLMLDDERLCGLGLTPAQRAGLRLQADFWRAVYREIKDREPV